jgi:hypothetical protein
MLIDAGKPWYTSVAIWGSVMGFLVSAMGAFNLVNVEQSKILIAEGPQFMAAFATAILSLVSLYGRIVAKRTIGNQSKPNTIPVAAPAQPVAIEVPVG